MIHEIKIATCSLSVWGGIFSLFQVFLICMMVGTFCSRHWVHTEFTLYLNKSEFNNELKTYKGYFDGMNFIGRADRCDSGCYYTYSKEASDWCEIYDGLKSFEGNCDSNCKEIHTTKSLCSLFSSLYTAFIIFIIFEILAIISVVVWITLMVYFIRKNKFLLISYLFSGLSCVFHYIATFVWIKVSKSNFNDSCSSLPLYGAPPDVCTTTSPMMAVFDLGYIVLILVGYTILFYRAKKLRNTVANINEKIVEIRSEQVQINYSAIENILSGDVDNLNLHRNTPDLSLKPIN